MRKAEEEPSKTQGVSTGAKTLPPRRGKLRAEVLVAREAGLSCSWVLAVSTAVTMKQTLAKKMEDRRTVAEAQVGVSRKMILTMGLHKEKTMQALRVGAASKEDNLSSY